MNTLEQKLQAYLPIKVLAFLAYHLHCPKDDAQMQREVLIYLQQNIKKGGGETTVVK